jgi:hypothetical protein
MRTYLSILCLFAFGIVAKAQSTADNSAIAALKVISTSYLATSRSVFAEPEDYIKDADGRIIGQNIFSPSISGKFLKVLLNWNGDKPTTASFDVAGSQAHVALTWTDNKVTRIAITPLDNFDYLVSYDDQGQVVALTSAPENSSARTDIFNLDYMDGKLVRVVKFENKPGATDNWTRLIQTYAWVNNGVDIGLMVFATGKPAVPKNAVQNTASEFRKAKTMDTLTQNIKGDPGNNGMQWVFDTDGHLIAMKESYDVRIATTKYTYLEDKVFKTEETAVDPHKKFISKSVIIAFDLPGAPASLPDQERKHGTYRYNEQNELIYEARDAKYRKKENGYWGDWTPTAY